MKIISRRARPSTITLYNLVSTTAGISTYQRTVIERVYLGTGYDQRLSQRGVSTSDKAQLIIDTRDIAVTSDREFLDAKSWDALTDKAGHFTFHTANDFFVEGNVADTLPTETKATMQKKYQVFSITSVAVHGDILQILGR